MTRPFFSKDRLAHLQIFERYVCILSGSTFPNGQSKSRNMIFNVPRHADHALRIMKERLREGYAVDWQVSKHLP